MSRLLLALLFAATAAPLAAFFAQPKGYSLAEYPQTSGTGGPAWDQASGGTDFYAHNTGGIRRFDTGAGAYVGSLMFPAPLGDFFDTMAIDPDSPDDFYVSYSSVTNSSIYKLNRTAPDTSSVVTSVSYASPDFYIYRLVFVPDLPSVPTALRGLLLAAATPVSTFTAGIYVIDKTTLAMTPLIDMATANGNGPFGVDESGNVYASIPTVFGSPTGSVLLSFDAADLVTALTTTPVAASQGTALIAASDAEWNITALTVREESGNTFIYYSTYEHASIKRMCLQTGETREFIQGFGGVSEGFQHFAQGGTLAFSRPTDDFEPQGGGAVRLLVPFSVFTPGFGSYNSVFLFDPDAVNATVASLVVTQQPPAINNGVPFTLALNALNSSATPINGDAGVVVTASAGTLDGFTVVCLPGDSIILDGLELNVSTLPASITFTIALTGNPGISVTTTAIAVVAPAAELAVTAQPTSVADSEFFAVTLEVRATGGAVVQSGPDASREVSVAVVSGPGNVWGALTETGNAGVVQFDSLIFDAPGNYVLEFTSPGLPAETASITVTTASSGNGGDDDGGSDDNGSCSAGSGSAPVFAGLLGLILVACALRRRRSV